MLNRDAIKQPRGKVMAYWMSTSREWIDFCHWRQHNQKRNGLCRILCNLMRFTRFPALIEAIFVKTNDIIITNTGVSVNGRFKAFAGESRTLQHVHIIDEISPRVLQICYQSNTGFKIVSNEIYVPIPKGRLGEAVKLMSLLESC
jgi:hypothetical protein